MTPHITVTIPDMSAIISKVKNVSVAESVSIQINKPGIPTSAGGSKGDNDNSGSDNLTSGMIV